MFLQYFWVIINDGFDLFSGLGFNMEPIHEGFNLIPFMSEFGIFEDTCQKLESVLDFYFIKKTTLVDLLA